jgi:hypothetical protein
MTWCVFRGSLRPRPTETGPPNGLVMVSGRLKLGMDDRRGSLSKPPLPDKAGGCCMPTGAAVGKSYMPTRSVATARRTPPRARYGPAWSAQFVFFVLFFYVSFFVVKT